MPNQQKTDNPSEVRLLLSEEEVAHCLKIAILQNKKGEWKDDVEGVYRDGILADCQAPFLGVLGEFCSGFFLDKQTDEEVRLEGDVADFICSSDIFENDSVFIDVKTQKKNYINRNLIPRGQSPIVQMSDYYHFTRFNQNLKDFYVFTTFGLYFPGFFEKIKEGKFIKCPIIIHGYITKEEILKNLEQRKFISLAPGRTENFAVLRKELSPISRLKEIIDKEYPEQIFY
jgi:hypothetical protein